MSGGSKGELFLGWEVKKKPLPKSIFKEHLQRAFAENFLERHSGELPRRATMESYHRVPTESSHKEFPQRATADRFVMNYDVLKFQN